MSRCVVLPGSTTQVFLHLDIEHQCRQRCKCFIVRGQADVPSKRCTGMPASILFYSLPVLMTEGRSLSSRRGSSSLELESTLLRRGTILLSKGGAFSLQRGRWVIDSPDRDPRSPIGDREISVSDLIREICISGAIRVKLRCVS